MNQKLREFYGDDYLTTTRGFSEPYPDYVSHGGKSYHYKDFRDIDFMEYLEVNKI